MLLLYGLVHDLVRGNFKKKKRKKKEKEKKFFLDLPTFGTKNSHTLQIHLFVKESHNRTGNDTLETSRQM